MEKFIINKKHKGLIHNIHILTPKKFFVQVMNNCDKYFSYKCQEKSFTFRNNSSFKYNIIEYEFNGTGPYDITDPGFTNEKEIEISMKPFDFKLFLIKFD